MSVGQRLKLGLAVLAIAVVILLPAYMMATNYHAPSSFPPGWRCVHYGKGATVCEGPPSAPPTPARKR